MSDEADRRIVVGVEGSGYAREALVWAIEEAHHRGAVVEVVDLVMAELQELRDRPILSSELERAKDHLKGSLVLSLESTSSRMSQLARQEIYFGRQVTVDDTLRSVERVTLEDVQRVARDLFQPGRVAATVLGRVDGLDLRESQLGLV